MRAQNIEDILFAAAEKADKPAKKNGKAHRRAGDARTAALSAGARRTAPRMPVRQFNRGR